MKLFRLDCFTPERRAAKKELLAREVCRPDGTWTRISEATLRRRLKAKGYAELTRQERSDKGHARIAVTREWDRAVPFDAPTRRAIALKLDLHLKGLHKAHRMPARMEIDGRIKLKELTREAGFDPGDAALDAICAMPANLLRAGRNLRKVYRLEKNRKAHEDAKPRQRRDRTMPPMHVVVGDVHPSDIYYTRPDGSQATAKLVAWWDVGTNAFFVTVHFLEKGKGITNRIVIESFIAMVEAWGCPTILHVDNGAEYGWPVLINDALKLIDQSGRRMMEVSPIPERYANVIRSKPYNASAKPIEGGFRQLEYSYLRHIPGWVSGNRLAKQSANVGGKIEPFPGTEDELREQILDRVKIYNATPQRRSKLLKGQSPNKVIQNAIISGWGKVAVDPDALRIAFSEEKPKKNRGGSIEYRGRFYTCDELVACLDSDVFALIPRYGDCSRIPILDSKRKLIGIATEKVAHGYLDPAGARESSRTDRLFTKAIRDAGKAVPSLDMEDLDRKALNDLPPEPVRPIGAKITPTRDVRELIAAFKSAPLPLTSQEDRDAAHRARMREIIGMLPPRLPASK